MPSDVRPPEILLVSYRLIDNFFRNAFFGGNFATISNMYHCPSFISSLRWTILSMILLLKETWPTLTPLSVIGHDPSDRTLPSKTIEDWRLSRRMKLLPDIIFFACINCARTRALVNNKRWSSYGKVTILIHFSSNQFF